MTFEPQPAGPTFARCALRGARAGPKRTYGDIHNNNNNTFNDSRGQDGPIVNVTEMLSSGLKYIMTDIKSIDNIVP